MVTLNVELYGTTIGALEGEGYRTFDFTVSKEGTESHVTILQTVTVNTGFYEPEFQSVLGTRRGLVLSTQGQGSAPPASNPAFR